MRLESADDFEKVRVAAEAQILASRAEGGCIDYAYALDVLDPKIMRVHEQWKDWAALDAHFKQSHMTPWRASLAGVNYVERSLRAHEVCETREV